jgi:hypothetical protein
MSVHDFDHDGHLDILVANWFGGNTIALLRGVGDGTFAASSTTPVGANPEGLAVADFDGDGNLDAAVATYTDGDVELLLGHGDGTFAAPVLFPVGSGASGLVAGDFNGDGRPDLVSTGGPIAVLLATCQ